MGPVLTKRADQVNKATEFVSGRIRDKAGFFDRRIVRLRKRYNGPVCDEFGGSG